MYRRAAVEPLEKRQVLSAAVGCDAAVGLLDAFDAEQLHVCAMDVRNGALTRACAGLTDATGFTAILDLGWQSAELSLLYQNTVIYVRSLTEAGVSRLRDALAARLKVEPEVADYLLQQFGLTARNLDGNADGDAADLPPDARSLISGHFDSIAQELTASFSYAVHQYRDAAVTRLLVVGGGAAVPGLAEHLAAAVGIEALTVSPAALMPSDPALADVASSPALTAALGLAMYPEL